MTPDFDGKRFSYPGENLLASPWDVLRWAVTRKATKWPKNLTNPPADQLLSQLGSNQLRLTFINHATVLIQGDGINILTDPVFSKRVSPVSFAGPKRYRPAGIHIEELPPIDCILLSHTHYDHMDLRSLKKIGERNAPIILTPLNTQSIVAKATQTHTREMTWWNSYQLQQTEITMVPARHWTSRKPGDQNKALWGGFIIKFSAGTVYFAGDSGYGNGDLFRLIQERQGPIHCALLPIGAYEPRWFMSPQHMNPSEAVSAFKDLQANYALGIHFGTFQLTDEAHDAPEKALHEALNSQAISPNRFRTLANGGAWDLPLI